MVELAAPLDEDGEILSHELFEFGNS